MSDNITRPYKGMSTDTSPIDQPKETYRYALNTVDESTAGDIMKLSNEQGQKSITSLPRGYICLGSVNMTKNRIVLFLVSPETLNSEIGILEGDVYSTVVNDSNSVNKLDFRPTNQIEGIYRLRAGCEDTIYFVDGKKVYYYNFAKPEDFKIDGLWNASLFKLQKTLQAVSDFASIEIVDGGNLLPGSYSAAIQFLDYDLNPTEWVIATDTVIIYSDRNNKEFGEIRGSQPFMLEDDSFVDKAIRFNMKNIDKSFPYYRIAVVERNNLEGSVRKTRTSEPIPTELNSYLFTGSETREVPFEELQVFDFLIDSATHITTVDNQLILAGVKGKKADYCQLQSYASLITVDCTTKNIELNNLDAIGNPKRGTVHLEYMGYQPGEIYSLGIVYVFKDGTKSPVFHIPGKSHSSAGVAHLEGKIPMSIDNEVEAYYTDLSNNCSERSYWGVDSEGELLTETTKVRHHRFPTRHEAGIGFVKTSTNATEGSRIRTLQISFKTRFKESTLNPGVPVDFVLTYYVGGQAKTATVTVDELVVPVGLYYTLDMGIVIDQALDSERVDGKVTNFVLKASGERDDNSIDVIDDDLRDVTLTLIEGASDSFTERKFSADIMGLVLSNVQKPQIDSEEDIIGYYIVRQTRDEYNKTVLDTGIMYPLIEDTHYTAFGQLRPSTVTGNAHGSGNLESRQRQWLYRQKKSTNFMYNKIPTKSFAFIHPQFLFNRKEYPNAEINVDGYFKTSEDSVFMDHQLTEDVMAGTSYDSSRNSKREKDSDGFTLHTLTRYSPLEFSKTTLPTKLSIKDTFYLDTLYGKTVTEDFKSREIYNLSADNRIGIVTTTDSYNLFGGNKYPYVSLTRELPGAYTNFRVQPYYLDSKEMHTFDASPNEIFGGDCYISPITYSSSMYYNTRIRKRKAKKPFLKFLIASILIAAAVVVNVVPVLGQAASAAIGTIALASLTGATAALALTMASNGFKQAQANKVYNELYDKGLKDCVDDGVTSEIFDNHNPDDDEVQWFMDTTANIWVESQINMNWRFGTDNVSTDFLNSPIKYNEAEVSEYLINKLTSFDKDNSEGKLYNGFANPEVYAINGSYHKRNLTKIFTPLGLEYDCCSDCSEEFPHRVAYSQQSFQEELTDNYRKFLPNNYRDLDGETGKITNMFTWYNNLYLHTEEALWLVPRNYQERITDQVVSFLGTGSFFSVPPQKIMDSSTGATGGLQHKWAATKTPKGYVYISAQEGKVYLFDGKGNQPISEIGISKDFTRMLTPKEDNPVVEDLGGYLVSYDPFYNRVLLTSTNEFTISYSLNGDCWRSYHSYLPCIYFSDTADHYQMYYGDSNIYKTGHGDFQTYNQDKQPHVVQFISVSSPIQQRKWNSIRLDTEVYLGDVYVDNKTFTQAGLYNTTQSTGKLNLTVDNPSEYMLGLEVENSNDNSILVTRENSSWYFNDFRDISVDPTEPILTNSLYPILNPLRTSLSKPWYEQTTLQDKWLGIRLEFITEEDYKITTDFIIDNEQPKM